MESQHVAVCIDLFVVGDSGRRGGGSGWFLIVRRDGDLGNNVSGSSMRWGSISTLVGWHPCPAWAVGVSARSMRSRGGDPTSRRGGGPGCGATFVVCERLPWAAWAAGSRVARRCCSRGVVVCRGGGPGRRCRLIALGARERWMSGRRPRETHCGGQTPVASMMVGGMSAGRQWLR